MVVLSSVASEGIPALGDLVIEERRKVLKMLENCLLRGVRDGDLPAETNVKPLARFFLTVQQGMSIQARAGTTAKELEAVASLAMQAWPHGH